MPRFAERLAEFGAALTAPELPAPPGLLGPDGQPSARRFAVYRNNVASGLIDALADAYPVVQRLVGADFFRAAARIFALGHPPESPVLLDYGAGFADFLDAFEPLAGHPYMGDVARLERGWIEAYHAPEAPPLAPEALQGAAAVDLGARPVVLHPSCRLIASDYPVGTIWQAHRGDGAPPPIDLAAGGETVLIARPGAEVALRILPPGAAGFLTALATGHALEAAGEAALRRAPKTDLAPLVAGLFGEGLVVGLGPAA